METVDDGRPALSDGRVAIGHPVDNSESHGEDLGRRIRLVRIFHRCPQLSTGLLGRTSSGGGTDVAARRNAGPEDPERLEFIRREMMAVIDNRQ